MTSVKRIGYATASLAFIVFLAWYLYESKVIEDSYEKYDSDLVLIVLPAHLREKGESTQTYGWDKVTPFNYSAIRDDLNAITDEFSGTIKSMGKTLSCISQQGSECEQMKQDITNDYIVALPKGTKLQTAELIAAKYFHDACRVQYIEGEVTQVRVHHCEQKTSLIHWNYINSVGYPKSFVVRDGKSETQFIVKSNSQIGVASMQGNGDDFTHGTINPREIIAWAALDN